MLPYFLVFTITLIFAYFTEKILEKQKVNSTLLLCAFVVVFLPAVLAGLRDLTVGTDVLVYLVPVFDSVCDYGLETIYLRKDIETVFILLCYVVSLFSNDVHWVMFFISLIINGCVFLSLFRLHKYCSIFLGEAIYLFCMYGETFNTMRQCFAMVIFILAMTFFWERKKASFFVLMMLACSFHKTAVIGFGICLLSLLVERINIVRKDAISKLIIFVGIAICLRYSFLPLAGIALDYGFLPAKFQYYLYGEQYKFSIFGFLGYVLPYVFLVMRGKKMYLISSFVAFMIMDITMFFLRTDMIWLYRIASYFFYFRILSLSQYKLNFYRILKDKTLKYDDIMGIGVVISSVCYWFSFYVINRGHEIYPYTSQILGI